MTENGEVLEKTETGGAAAGTEDQKSLSRRRRRCLTWACGACVLLLIILGIVILILALVVFKVREPTTTLVSSTPRGITPRVSFAPLKLEINLTLDIDLLVYNPNRASFSHSGGATSLTIRGIPVGDGEVLPGRVPARGSTHVYTRVTVDAAKFILIPDAASVILNGRLELNASTVIPGRVSLLGFIRRSATAYSDCEFVFSTPILGPPSILQQQCRQRTRL